MLGIDKLEIKIDEIIKAVTMNKTSYRSVLIMNSDVSNGEKDNNIVRLSIEDLDSYVGIYPVLELNNITEDDIVCNERVLDLIQYMDLVIYDRIIIKDLFDINMVTKGQ